MEMAQGIHSFPCPPHSFLPFELLLVILLFIFHHWLIAWLVGGREGREGRERKRVTWQEGELSSYNPGFSFTSLATGWAWLSGPIRENTNNGFHLTYSIYSFFWIPIRSPSPGVWPHCSYQKDAGTLCEGLQNLCCYQLSVWSLSFGSGQSGSFFSILKVSWDQFLGWSGRWQ